MPSDSDLLCGRIAIELGFCTEAQVEQCLRAQATSRAPMPLGRHMIEEAVLTEDQHSRVLEAQRKRMRRIDPVVNASKEEALFGTLAVKEGLVSREQLNACLRLQGRPGEKRSLGEIMRAEGLLTTGQVRGLLARQSKRIMSCAPCGVSFTVHTITPGKAIPCPRCKKPLQDGKPGESVRTDGEVRSDSVLRMSPPPAAGGTGQRCRICGHGFKGAPSSDGRLECPACHVRFVP
jgi:DNA-directed RNA polymerase subunit RPC12/RpoP